MDDLEFIQHCVKGEKQSWEHFLKQYSRLIYSYIYSVLKTKGFRFAEDNVNDIFQEIFLLLVKDNFQKLRSFQGKNGCSLASWLRQVAINFTIDYLRKLKPALSLEARREDGHSLQDSLADNSSDTPEILVNAEKAQSLKECIEGLSIDDKYFVELHFNRAIKLESLITYFRQSRGAIDMRKSRIVERLKDCFRSKGFALDF